jgi:hypothetical protein
MSMGTKGGLFFGVGRVGNSSIWPPAVTYNPPSRTVPRPHDR